MPCKTQVLSFRLLYFAIGSVPTMYSLKYDLFSQDSIMPALLIMLLIFTKAFRSVTSSLQIGQDIAKFGGNIECTACNYRWSLPKGEKKCATTSSWYENIIT